jgi:hypothetical protein
MKKTKNEQPQASGLCSDANSTLLKTNPAAVKLRDLLLSHEGKRVSGLGVRPDYDIPETLIRPLLEFGCYRIGKGACLRKRGMKLGRCHANAQKLVMEGKEPIYAIGFALSEDGYWRPHSWCVSKKGNVVETTARRVSYYGVEFPARAILNRATVRVRKHPPRPAHSTRSPSRV